MIQNIELSKLPIQKSKKREPFVEDLFELRKQYFATKEEERVSFKEINENKLRGIILDIADTLNQSTLCPQPCVVEIFLYTNLLFQILDYDPLVFEESCSILENNSPSIRKKNFKLTDLAEGYCDFYERLQSDGFKVLLEIERIPENKKGVVNTVRVTLS